METVQWETELFHTYGRTDSRKDMTTLTVTLRNFAEKRRKKKKKQEGVFVHTATSRMYIRTDINFFFKTLGCISEERG